MLTIKSSSTRSPAPWVLCTEDSRLDCSLRVLVSSFALLATSQSASLLWPSSLTGAGTCALSGLLVLVWLWRQRPARTVLKHDGAGRWSVHQRARVVHGPLCPGGYSSQWVIVLCIQPEGARCRWRGVHRCIVWRDAVNPRDFSYLQMMMMTTTLSENQEGTSA